MKTMEQDEEYEEDLEDDEDLDYEEEGDEDTEPQIDTIYGIPKKYVVIGGAILLIVVIAVFVISTMKKSSDEEVYVPPVQTEITEPEITEPIQEVSYADGDVGPNGMVWDETTQSWCSQEIWDMNHEEPTLESLSTENELLLRKMGYTGDEIQLAMQNGFSIEALVGAAQELHDEESIESLKRMSDHASEEFRYIVNNTYFSQPGFVFENQLDLEFADATFYDGQFTVNSDYTKCPSYGAQLQLKCRISNDLYIWYVVTPRRWETLPESGNIVLNVGYTVWGSYAYITTVAEVDPSLATIDASADASISDNIEGTSGGSVAAEEVIDPANYQDATVLGETSEVENNDEIIEEDVNENVEEDGQATD